MSALDVFGVLRADSVKTDLLSKGETASPAAPG